jgi:phospholipid/cholesterol/gamma-HCH transport system ATP-binding protein
MPERQAVARRQERVRHILHTLPEAAQQAILESLEHENTMSDFIGSEAPTTVLPRVAL